MPNIVFYTQDDLYSLYKNAEPDERALINRKLRAVLLEFFKNKAQKQH